MALLLALASYVLVAAIVYESLEEVFGRRAAIAAAAFWPPLVLFTPAVIGAVLVARLVGHAVAEWRRGRGR